MEIVQSPAEMQRWAKERRASGESIGFVPTMGFLHEGHLDLMRRARARCDRVVVSIFVNPLQFGPKEDLSRYPRDPEGDAARCRSVAVDLLWTPGPKEMYPPGFQTRVVVGSLASGLCGASRPGHFDGVATVVLKLLQAVSPDHAFFGRKDYQQLRVIEQMVDDFHLPVRIEPCPTVREADGLAMSSRNTYLGPEDRQAALCLSRGLSAAEGLHAGGERSAEALLHEARAVIAAEPRADIDYISLVDERGLQPVHGTVAGPALLAVAVRFGNTRLIDNRVLP